MKLDLKTWGLYRMIRWTPFTAGIAIWVIILAACLLASVVLVLIAFMLPPWWIYVD